MLDRKTWRSVSALIHPKGVLSGWGQDSVQASQVHPHQTLSSMSFCTVMLEQEGAIPSQTNTVLLATAKPRLVHHIVRWKSAIHHSREHVSTALRVQWQCAPLHPMLCIALADVWLGCSCSAMETHSMKLSTHCSWANLKATWSLEVCSDWLCRKLATSAHNAPQHLLTPLRHFTWPTTLWLSCCRSQSFPLCYNTTDGWPLNI